MLFCEKRKLRLPEAVSPILRGKSSMIVQSKATGQILMRYPLLPNYGLCAFSIKNTPSAVKYMIGLN
jgi:hypothetical protein